ncbi:MAG: MmgE/PrpD family protein [Alphaproteobacteria bacterium]|nr:MmgE/PrpD family protein [Alphaproteobacteria bacterium]
MNVVPPHGRPDGPTSSLDAAAADGRVEDARRSCAKERSRSSIVAAMTSATEAGDPAGQCEFDDVIAWARAPLPPAVERKARLLLLDSIGCIASGLRHPEVQRLGESLAPWFPGPIRLPGAAIPLGPAGAAALGAAAMCWDEANEGLAQAHGRPALPIVPALLALADSQPFGGLLQAFALGYEVGARAGEVWRIRPGMHVDGSWHALGAAAACALATGADPARAVRIAACQIPFSLYRPLAHGMTGRNAYPAHAALLGILAAAAAKAGSEAPAGGLAEARHLALLHQTPAQRSAAGTWLIADGYVKPFAGVRHAHYAAAAAIAARARVESTDAVVALRLETYGEALRYAANRAPRTPIAAQFSLSFAVAAGLRFGDLAPDAYRALGDPGLVRLEGLVELAEDPAMTAAGRRGARLIMRTALDTVTTEVDSVPGDPARPMREDEVAAKFLRLAGHLPDAAATLDRVMRGAASEPLRL